MSLICLASSSTNPLNRHTADTWILAQAFWRIFFRTVVLKIIITIILWFKILRKFLLVLIAWNIFGEHNKERHIQKPEKKTKDTVGLTCKR